VKKFIDVDQQAIARRDPCPINVRVGALHLRASFVDVLGAVQARCDYERPCSFGARVWVETEGPVVFWDSSGEPTLLS